MTSAKYSRESTAIVSTSTVKTYLIREIGLKRGRDGKKKGGSRPPIVSCARHSLPAVKSNQLALRQNMPLHCAGHLCLCSSLTQTQRGNIKRKQLENIVM